MTGYDVIVFFHVLSAVVWVGGGVMIQALMARAAKIGPETVGHFSQAAAWTSNHIFIPASFAALISGIWAVVAGPWNFSDPFVGIGITGYILSALIGMAILGPTSKKMNTLAEQRGPNDPVVTQLGRRLNNFGKVDLFILIVVVFTMVTKPGT